MSPAHDTSGRRRGLALPFCLLLAPAVALHAQEPQPTPRGVEMPGGITAGKDGFVLPAGAVAVEDLINGAALFLARNVLWHPQELQNQPDFVFQRRLALDAIGCEELLHELLASRGLVVVPIDESKQVYEVISMAMQRRGEIFARAVPKSPEEVLQRPNLEQFVLTNLPLQHIDATSAQNALRPFFAQGGSQHHALMFGTSGTGEALLITGFTEQVAACIRIVRECDQPLQKRNPQLHELQQQVVNLQISLGNLQTQFANAQQQIATLQAALQSRSQESGKDGGGAGKDAR